MVRRSIVLNLPSRSMITGHAREAIAVATVVTLLGVAVSCARPQPGAESRARAELQSVRDSFISAVLQGDTHATAAFFTDDADLLAPNLATIRTRDSIQALFAGFTGHSKVMRYEITPEVIVARGDTALENGTYLEDVTQDGTRSLTRGRYMFWWLRTNGSWRIRRSLFNLEPQHP